MQQPTRLISTPFAQEGEKTEIQNVTGEFDNSATYRLGFPPLTMQSIRLGGKPPKGTDFNGVLFDITENISFLCKGGRYQYNAGLSTLIGGYPEGSNLLLDDNVTEVVSTVAGNQNNPNTDMTGWIFKPNRTTAEYVLDASGETQQQVNYNGGSKWHSRVSGYKLNERVVLANGDIVKNTIDGNANDPNVDMTGWVPDFDTSAIQAEISTINTELSLKADTTYVDNQDALKADKTYVDTALSSLSTDATKFYPTLALANADIANLAANQPVTIGESANGGLWYKATAGATSLTKSAYDPLTQAKADATTKANAAEANAKAYTDEEVDRGKSDIESTLQDGLGLANFVGSGVIPLYTDENNKILMGYDPVKQEFVGNILDKLSVSKNLNSDGLFNFIGSGIIPLIVDVNNKILFGYDSTKNKLVGDFDTGSDYGQYIAAINHLMTYGQSLSTGSGSLPLLSVSQPSNNVKFIGGIRGNTEFGSLVPLTEDSRRDQGEASNGETPVSGAANYATMSAYRDNGIATEKHVILGSAAGIGGKRIEFLVKGTEQYDEHLLAHIRGGAALNPDYTYQATMWLQGESDELTDYATYKNMFYKLIDDIATDVRKISKQTFDPAFITYQTSAYTTTTATPAKAQLEAIKDGKAFLSCPVYRFDVLSDGLHLTNASSKLMGCYFGRVYKQLVVDKRKPDWLEPLSASINDKVIRVKFKTPKLPLVFDTISMGGGQITDYGFAVTNAANVKQTISTVVIDGDAVVITLADTPSESLKVRYAMDYAPSFIGNSASGGRGNLRDSTDDLVVIDGTPHQMFHVAPHFEMNIKALGV